MISYGLNAEDVLLNRLFPVDYKGFYIDVGAADPVTYSVTKHFYDRGWHGLNIEPSIGCERLCEFRTRDINLNIAASDRNGTANYYEYLTSLTDSTLSPGVLRENESRNFPYIIRTVGVLTLAEICSRYVGGQTIDFMCVDVEGHEYEVIRGADWKRWRPRVLVIEATRPHSRELSHVRWEPILIEHHYLFALFDGLNRYYVRKEDEGLLKHLTAPACVFDDYIPYPYQHEIDRLRGIIHHLQSTSTAAAAVDPVEGRFAPGLADQVAGALAKRLRTIAGRFPRLAARSKPLLRYLVRLRHPIGSMPH
jgi:FkbM family methyltransferase